MNRYFIRLSYAGTNYHGWQLQKNAHSVQAEIMEKLSMLLGVETHVLGCGRTDTGVHAREFFAHFDAKKIPFTEIDLAYKLNRFLPADITIEQVFQVEPDLHARFGAISRTYRYYIARKKTPFYNHLSYFYDASLNVQAMQNAAVKLLDYKDFTSFSKLHTQTATNNCSVTEASWELDGEMLVFSITADRFLRNMVRAVVGTLLEIGKEKISVEDMQNIIEAKDRSKAGFSVPAHGLFLEHILYPFNY